MGSGAFQFTPLPRRAAPGRVEAAASTWVRGTARGHRRQCSVARGAAASSQPRGTAELPTVPQIPGMGQKPSIRASRALLTRVSALRAVGTHMHAHCTPAFPGRLQRTGRRERRVPRTGLVTKHSDPAVPELPPGLREPVRVTQEEVRAGPAGQGRRAPGVRLCPGLGANGLTAPVRCGKTPPGPGQVSGRQPPAAVCAGPSGPLAALFRRSVLGTTTASWPRSPRPHSREPEASPRVLPKAEPWPGAGPAQQRSRVTQEPRPGAPAGCAEAAPGGTASPGSSVPAPRPPSPRG